MKKQLIFSGALILISLFRPELMPATGVKSSELRLKMAEIASLQQDLTGKINQAIEKKNQLKQKKQTLNSDISDQNEQFNIETYQKAVLNPRIDYNLKLIQLLLGYITRLNEKIVYFENGHDMLIFFSRQAQDDLLLIKTLDDMEIDKLIAQINEVLDVYSPEISEPMFDVNDVPLKDTQQIWQETIKNK